MPTLITSRRSGGEIRPLAKCEQCGRELSTQASLLQHLKDKHGTTLNAPAVTEEAPRPAKAGRQRPKSYRKRNRHPALLAIIAAILVGIVGFYFAVAPQLSQPFPCSAGENYIHVHPYVRIVINGENVTIPSGLGISNPAFRGGIAVSGSCFEPIHTHDTSGIVHVELSNSGGYRNFTLSDFFKVWAWAPGSVDFNGTTAHPIVFTPTDVLGYQADATHKVVLLVDGEPSTAYGLLPLEQYDYCNASNANVPPCSPTAGGDPLWNGGSNYPYGTGHTIVIEYVTT